MTFEGTVEARNERGIKVDGEWLNVSKYHVIHDLPEVGETVRGEVDSKGFLKSVSSIDAPWIPTTNAEPRASEREERIARLTVLKAAANFAAARSDIKSADVLTIADRWLAWVMQEGSS